MIRQVTCGFIALAGITLLIESAVGQAPQPDPKELAKVNEIKELAKAYEMQAAALTNPKEANAEWSKALKERTTLFVFAQAKLKNLPANAAPADVKAAKSNLYDAYFEIQRVIATANVQLIQNPMQAAAKAETIGKKICDLENYQKFNEVKMVPGADGKPMPIKLGTELINVEVWTRYCDFLDQFPAVKKGYKDAGGEFFLERPKPE